MLLIASITVILSIMFILMPYLSYKEDLMRREFQRKLHLVKLIAVKKFYPQLSTLEVVEIERRYNLDEIYNNIKPRIRRYDHIG